LYIKNKMKLKIHPKTKKILNKILKINISKEKDLNIDLAKIADSLKYLEILLMTEKESRKKITNNKILKIKDINNLFNEKK
jgi:acyl carrier protein